MPPRRRAWQGQATRSTRGEPLPAAERGEDLLRYERYLAEAIRSAPLRQLPAGSSFQAGISLDRYG